MELNTVIFDMDGLLIDSEPLWNEAANEVFGKFNIRLSAEQYKASTGLRTQEFVQLWFRLFDVDEKFCEAAILEINNTVLQKIKDTALPMPGVKHIFSLFEEAGFKAGIASSSPVELIELVMDKCTIRDFVHAVSSAQHLSFGKPHPQVYLDCAAALGAAPLQCICFEDSFNGMIAAKAARMKCVVVPHPDEALDKKWGAADLQIASLENFSKETLYLL